MESEYSGHHGQFYKYHIPHCQVLCSLSFNRTLCTSKYMNFKPIRSGRSSEYIGAQKWGFELKRGTESQVKWSEIPNETDILLTHGPAVGHGDRCLNGLRQG